MGEVRALPGDAGRDIHYFLIDLGANSEFIEQCTIVSVSMIELFKDASEAWLQRIRSPILGSVTLVFLALNWKPIFYLVYADQSVPVKINYAVMNSTPWTLYLGPILIGFVIAFITPWVRLGGAWLAIAPVNFLRKIEYDQVHSQNIYRLTKDAEGETASAKLEDAQERRTIQAARRIEEAKQIEGSDVVDEILQQRVESNSSDNIEDIVGRMSTVSKTTLKILGQQGDSANLSDLADDSVVQKSLGEIFPKLSSVRAQVELETAVNEMQKMGFTDTDRYGRWHLTKTGFEGFDLLK